MKQKKGLDGLANIDTFEIAGHGTGQLNIEIAAATELNSEAPDDWRVAVTRNFNREKLDRKE